MRDHERIETSRLVLRRPLVGDALAIFERYASDAEITRFLGWPRHQTVDDTRTFLRYSDAEWNRWPAGPYLILSRADGQLLGSTGLSFEARDRAMTGYVLAKDSWGRGYAAEALQEMVNVARCTGVARLYALCHPQHRASWRVLEKCAFTFEGRRRAHTEFPNLSPGVQLDVLCYSLALVEALDGAGEQAAVPT